MQRKRIIVYWEFNIDILGPRYEKLEERRKARKKLSKQLRQIERVALLAVEARLPSGFRATIS